MFLNIILFAILQLFFPDLKSNSEEQNEIPVLDTRELLSIMATEDDTVRLFNFWATWCKPCVKELPYFEEMNVSKKGEKFRLFLVSLDFKDQYKKRLLPFIKKKDLKSTVLLFDGGNPNDWIDKIHPDWSGSIPASLITYKGQKCFEENSFEDYDALNYFINHCKTNFKS
jgi:thiol-disulfide isomerase/thioredoxin